MSTRIDSLDLARLRLVPGEARALDLLVPVDAFEYGGQRYETDPDAVSARLDLTRTVGDGYALRLRFEARLSGPCMRCLEAATPSFQVDAREVDQPDAGDELDSPYIQDAELDLRGWARDVLALELSPQMVCRDECLGICAVCGENLNDADPDHHHERPPDGRWAKLAELRFEAGG